MADKKPKPQAALEPHDFLECPDCLKAGRDIADSVQKMQPERIAH